MQPHRAATPRTGAGSGNRLPWKLFGGLFAVNVLALVSTWIEVTLPWPKPLGFPLMLVSGAGTALALATGLSILGTLALLGYAIFFPNTRKLVSPALALTAVLAATSLPAQLAGLVVWDRGFTRIAGDGEPLVAAIRKFEADRGRPPADLDALVSAGYLSAIPATPVGCSPYRYELKRCGNPWTLAIKPPFRGIGFDSFEYWPQQDYAARREGARCRRFGEWAYYHGQP